MTTRKVKAFSFTDEEWEQLKAISKDTGLKDAEVIRELINKAFIDKKTREIITKENFWRKMSGRTSHNVQCVNEKKDEASHETSMAVSSNCRLNDTIIGKLMQTGRAIWSSKDQDAWNSFCIQYHEIAVRVQAEQLALENAIEIAKYPVGYDQ